MAKMRSLEAYGINVGQAGNTFISNNVYNNPQGGLFGSGVSVLWVGGNLGFTAGGASAPDGASEIVPNAASAEQITLKGVLMPNAAISTAGLTSANSYILSYNPNYGSGASTGTVQVWGDYQISGSTFTLDFSTNSYAATATTPKAMRGSSIAVMISTSDANAGVATHHDDL